ncbi:DASH complex subunit ask1 [Pseudogymnoascus australis]
MSRASTSSQRNLTLTEELEKLEQTITLTLQEIDHNFSRAHRIVTTSILPIVEQYGKHSEAVWDGSKVCPPYPARKEGYLELGAPANFSQFWKQFFEASANVSLSGYEELQHEEEEDTAISHSHGNSTYGASLQEDDSLPADTTHHHAYGQDDDSLLDNGDISGSTPRAPPSRTATGGKFADYGSPYESLKREMKGGGKPNEEEDYSDSPLPHPTTPGTSHRLPRMSMTPLSSPFEPTTHLPTTTRAPDPLLHRVMDKNYRLQATPHTAQKQAKAAAAAKPSWRDLASPSSSSPIQAPQLHHEIFSSPIRQPQIRPSAAAAPRTPGVSVQTPARGRGMGDGGGVTDEITWDSDSEDAEDVYKTLGMSPPKTIQFAIPPNRVLQTPAREASKRIVEDLLMTAGAGGYYEEEDSPSMVKPSNNLLDDSF